MSGPTIVSIELRTPVLGPQVQEVHQADVKVHNREGGCIGCGLVGRGVAIVHTANQAMPCVVIERAEFFGPGMGVGCHL